MMIFALSRYLMMFLLILYQNLKPMAKHSHCIRDDVPSFSFAKLIFVSDMEGQ